MGERAAKGPKPGVRQQRGEKIKGFFLNIKGPELRKAERIISVKTLTNEAPSQPRNVERVVATGQYL